MSAPHPGEPSAPGPGEPGPADVAQALRDGIAPSTLLDEDADPAADAVDPGQDG